MSEATHDHSKVQIVPFDLKDAQELAGLALRTSADTYGYTFTEENFTIERWLWEQQLERASQVDRILVAKLAGEIVGYTLFGDSVTQEEAPVRPDSKELRKLYVAAELHRLGIGRQLMDSALADPVLATAPQVYLWVWGGNPGAINFYKGYDFSAVGARSYRGPDSKPTQDLLMVRDQTA